MFDSPISLMLGLLTGIVFGFLLQKGRAAKFEVIVGQFLLKDWTVLKIMGTAIVVGTLGVHALVDAEAASLHIRPLLLGGVLAGAVCFGIGIVLLGYCPGTTVAACGEGRRDAMVGVLGMFAGAAAFVAAFPAIQPLIQGLGDWGKLTIPQALNISPWMGVLALAGGGAALLLLLEWLDPGKSQRPSTPTPPENLGRFRGKQLPGNM